jgi:hypothetical protein
VLLWATRPLRRSAAFGQGRFYFAKRLNRATRRAKADRKKHRQKTVRLRAYAAKCPDLVALRAMAADAGRWPQNEQMKKTGF